MVQIPNDTQQSNSPNQIRQIITDIQTVYRNYQYPWVIGYSGGKDSTTTLQLIWLALRELPPEQLTNPIYVISTDTLVETPIIVNYTSDALRQMNEAAVRDNLPLTAHKLSPILDDKFWVNLIGRGYPAPNNNFRWCTERLKINPSNRFILSKVAEHGRVILALGTRRGESQRRDRVLAEHAITGYQRLSEHGKLRGAWVYTPIEHLTTNDVWKYLIQVESPWGGDNRRLSSLYQSAQDGECPLVVDETTPSCGHSRFGCWVCTVVTRDKSMEAMIDSGEEWMIPLLEFRDWLAETQNPAVKPQQREFRGRAGDIKITADGRLRYRTYTLDFSRQMLRHLLETQREMQEELGDESFLLIGRDELREIRRIWLTERHDWADTLPEIYTAVTGKTLKWEQNDLATPGQLEADLLNELADEYGVPLKLVQELLDAEWQHYGMKRRTTIHKAIRKILRADWRSREEVAAEVARRQKMNGTHA